MTVTLSFTNYNKTWGFFTLAQVAIKPVFGTEIAADVRDRNEYPLSGIDRAFRFEVVIYANDRLAELVPNVLIVDIEGGEFDLLEGAESLGSVDRISLELHPWVYGREGILRVFRALCRLGFAYVTDLSHAEYVVLYRT